MSPWIPAVITGAATLAGVIATVWVAITSRRESARQDVLAFQRTRRADAYVEALALAERFGQWFALVNPPPTPGAEQDDPPLPDWEAASHARAVMAAHGSPEARRLFEGWYDFVLVSHDISHDLRRVISFSMAGNPQPMPHRMHDDPNYRIAEGKFREKFAAQVYTELNEVPKARSHFMRWR